MPLIKNKQWKANEDAFLKQKFPGGSVPYAMMMLNRSAYEVRARVIFLKLDPDMIFETIKKYR